MPHRAEHIGSLLRPPEILGARHAFAAGRMTREELRDIEDRAIDAALRHQRDVGLDVVTDGEMRRGSWLAVMSEAVDGFVADSVMLDWRGPGGGLEKSSALAAGERLRKVRKLTEHEAPFLLRRAGAPFKITLPAPSNFLIASYKVGVTDLVYESRDAFLADAVAIVRDEVAWLVEQGVGYVQFDAPFYSHYLDTAQRERLRERGFDPDEELARAIAGDNAAVSGLPRDRFTLAVHVCRGNNRSRWYTEGSYDAIAETLFGGLAVDTLLLEYDDERSGGFEPLRLVPAGRTVVLGLVSTKLPALEPSDDLCRRIEEAAAHVPLERLALSPQCGFASIAPGNLLTASDQWRKLERVVEVSQRMWGSG